MKMVICAAILLLAAIAVAQQKHEAPQTGNTEIRLRGTVKNVVQLADFSGEIKPVHFDPRFAMTVSIVSAEPPVGDLTAGAIVTFGIHSPNQLFQGHPTQNKPYNFVLYRTVEGGKTRFFHLRVAD